MNTQTTFALLTRLRRLAVLAAALGGTTLFAVTRWEPPAAEGRGHAHDHGEKPKTAEKGEGAGHNHDHDKEPGGHEDEVTLTDDAIKRSGIRISKAASKVLVGTVTAPGRLSFNGELTAHVGSLVSGRATELAARVGDVVKKGDRLAVIDSAALGEAQSDYLQRKTSVESITPMLELAKASYERAKKVFDESQGVSLTEVQSRQREWRIVQGELAAARNALTAASSRLVLYGMNAEAVKQLEATGKISAVYEIRAPIDGQVIERPVTLGELVSPDKEALFVVSDLRALWVVADVPELQLEAIAGGQAVTIAVLGTREVKGRVSYVSPEIDQATRTGRVRIQVENQDRNLRAGTFVRVEISAGVRDGKAVVVVPDDAVQMVEGAPAVFVPVAGEPGTFAKRQVSVGAAVGNLVPVLSGLKEGEAFVVAGSFILKAELGKAGAAHEH